MIRPEITEETFIRVKIMSGKINCSFEEALKVLLDKYNEKVCGAKMIPKSNFTGNNKETRIVGLSRK